jgi:hypothetical protein
MPTAEGLEEAAARAVVSAALGVPVCHHNDGSAPGMVDALIKYPDGRVGAMEVVGDHDADFLALWEVLGREGHQTDVPGLASGWSISISHRVRFRRLLADLPELLSTWETAGLADLARPQTAAQEHLAAEASKRGIRGATVSLSE